MGRHFVVRLVCLLSSIAAPLAAEDAWTAAGAAPTDRVWTGAECRKFADLVANAGAPRPLLKDEAGAGVLKRFCARENLAAYLAAGATSAQMTDFLEMVSGTSVLGKCYIEDLEGGAKVGDEATLLMAHLLDVFAQGLKLIEKSGADAGEAPDSRIEHVKTGATEAFAGTTAAIASDETLSEANRSDLLAALARTVGPISKACSRITKAEMRRDFEKIKEQRTSAGDRSAIDTVLKALTPAG